MYLSGAGRGAFWPAGEVSDVTAGTHEVTVRAADPGGLAGTLDARRLVWLGDLRPPRRRRRRSRCRSPTRAAATSTISPTTARRAADAALRHARRGRLAGARRRDARARPGGREARLRRRHRAQRHPRALAADLPPQPLRPRAGRGALSHRPRRLPGPARRRGDAGAVRQAPARLLVAGLSDQPLPRHVPLRRQGSLRRRRRALRGRPFDDLEEACRQLFYDLLWFRVGEGVREGEETRAARPWSSRAPTTSPRAPTLARLFPEARFIHVVRDGRDASASRVAQTRGVVRPRTRVQGIAWWEERIARDRAGADAVGDGRLLTVSLDELVRLQRARAGAAAAVPLPRRAGDQAHAALLLEPDDDRGGEQGALARGHLGQQGAERVDRLYLEALERLEAAGARSAPLLRHALERSDDDLDPLVYVYDRGPMTETPAELVFVGGTGRSGTHILSYLLDRHSRFHGVPIECRFHCNPKGLADVVKGQHRARRSSCASCAATGGTACGSATAPTCGRSGGRSGAGARPRAALDRRRRSASRPRSRGSSASYRTTSSAPRATSSTTCSSRSPTRPASRCSSR